ncbi:DUF1828 domain-containing protein [Limosilactobacillus sp.]|uniref:DUF1828 domain-containing protein n=1 Tax=Limosilactobacillus sp. TaxID=2773925 RepID=UPI0025BD48A5|nr:DUF1828 domain-containing protein [Limosilactobacillus sp.]MCH3922969.1 DUF1828 domain-containing protein [Limosilactobacillus sp.]MCH3927652.1 DUF1828 domain-containing protein [Limosilactobacillus sp.]
MDNASLLENSYYKWLKDDLVFKNIEDNYVSISTPFIDTNFDNINLYARFLSKDKIEVSDFGYTIANLEDTGIRLDRRSKVAWRVYTNALNDFGVSREDETLLIKTSLDKFPVAKNRLLQAIMRINDISYLSKGNVKEAFNDIIEDFLLKKEILYTPNVEIATENGISSHFDFSIPSKSGMERLIKTSARPNDLNYAKAFNFDVRVTSPVRDNARFYYVLNDVTHKVKLKNQTINTALEGLKAGTADVSGFDDIMKNNNVFVNE